MPNKAAGINLWPRLFLTLALLAVIYFADLIPLPGLDARQSWPSVDHPRLSVIALGLNAFVPSFVLVELLSFIFLAGRRLRRGGIVGRRRLNTYAVITGVVLGLLQSAGIWLALRESPVAVGADAGLLGSISCISTLLGGSIFLFVLARLVSGLGFGNGFCLLIAFNLIKTTVHSPAFFSWVTLDRGNPKEGAVVLAVVGLLIWQFARPRKINETAAEPASVPWLTLPAFPQGLIPVTWAYTLFNLPSTLRPVLHLRPGESGRSVSDLLAIALLIAVFSFVTSYFFFSPERLARDLSPGVLIPKGEAFSRRSLLQSTALLVILGVTFPAAEWLFNFTFPALALPELVILISVGFDLVAEWRFRHKHDEAGVARLIELDNVYGACYLQGLLAKNGCDALIRGFHYRSLFFLFGPLFKMELLVPLAHLDRAWDLIEPENIEVV